MQKTWPNAIASASTFVWTALWLWRAILWVLDNVGRIQTAHDLYAASGVLTVPNLIVNWGIVYFILMVFSAAFLIALNSRFIRAAWRKHQEQGIYEWTGSLNDGAAYVAFASAYGEATKTHHLKQRLEHGLVAIWEATRIGKLAIGGSPVGSILTVPITRKEALNGRLKYKLPPHIPHGYQHLEFLELSVIQKDSDEQVYNRLVVDTDRIKQLWPRAKPDYRI